MQREKEIAGGGGDAIGSTASGRNRGLSPPRVAPSLPNYSIIFPSFFRAPAAPPRLVQTPRRLRRAPAATSGDTVRGLEHAFLFRMFWTGKEMVT